MSLIKTSSGTNFPVESKQKKEGIDYIGVSVVFFCHDGNGNFLMAKRSRKTRDEHGHWDIGGGALDFGEDVVTTLRREIEEEYGTKVLKHEFLGFRNVIRTGKDNNKSHWLALDFKVLVDPTLVKNGEPHKFDDVKWFTLATIPENSHSQFPEFLRLYRNRLTG